MSSLTIFVWLAVHNYFQNCNSCGDTLEDPMQRFYSYVISSPEYSRSTRYPSDWDISTPVIPSDSLQLAYYSGIKPYCPSSEEPFNNFLQIFGIYHWELSYFNVIDPIDIKCNYKYGPNVTLWKPFENQHEIFKLVLMFEKLWTFSRNSYTIKLSLDIKFFS